MADDETKGAEKERGLIMKALIGVGTVIKDETVPYVLDDVRGSIVRDVIEIPTYGRPVTEGVPRAMINRDDPQEPEKEPGQTPDDGQEPNDPTAGIEAPEISDPLEKDERTAVEKLQDRVRDTFGDVTPDRDRGIDR